MEDVPQRVVPTFEWMFELTKYTLGDGFIHTVGLRALVFRHVIGAEHLVPKGQEGGIICPDGLSFIRVMPVVKFRRNDEAMQPL